MLNNLNEFAPTIFAFCTTYLIHSTLVIGLTWVTARRLGSVVWQDRLWKWAIITPCLTTGLQFGLTTGMEFSLSESPGTVTAVELAPVRHDSRLQREAMTETLIEVDSIVAGPSGLTSAEPTAPAIRQPEPTPELVPAIEQPAPRSVLVLIFGCVTFLMIARTMMLRATLACWLRRSTTLDEGSLQRTINRIASQRGIARRIHVLTNDTAEPFSLGVFCWRIVLPHDCQERLSPAELDALLSHELAHLANRDPAWLWINRLICDLFWFQPLTRIAATRIRELSEFVSDEWATSKSVRPVDLASCLTTIAEWSTARRSRRLVSTAMGRRSTLARRIERLVEPKALGKEPRWRVPVAIACLSIGTPALVVTLPRISWASMSAPGIETPSIENRIPVSSSRDKDMEPRSPIDELTRDIERAMELLTNEEDHELRQLGNSLTQRFAKLRRAIAARRQMAASQGEGR